MNLLTIYLAGVFGIGLGLMLEKDCKLAGVLLLALLWPLLVIAAVVTPLLDKVLDLIIERL